MKQKPEIKKSKKEGKNRTWEANHELIESAYFKLLEQNKRVPTFKLLSEETKIGTTAIEKHLKELSLDKWKPYFKPMTKKIIQRLGLEAMKTGRSPEVKLFMQLMEDYREKNEVTGKDGESLITAISVNIIKPK